MAPPYPTLGGWCPRNRGNSTHDVHVHTSLLGVRKRCRVPPRNLDQRQRDNRLEGQAEFVFRWDTHVENKQEGRPSKKRSRSATGWTAGHAIRIEALAGLGGLIERGQNEGRIAKRGQPAKNSRATVLRNLQINETTAKLAHRLAALSDTECNAVAVRDKTQRSVLLDRLLPDDPGRAE